MRCIPIKEKDVSIMINEIIYNYNYFKIKEYNRFYCFIIINPIILLIIYSFVYFSI